TIKPSFFNSKADDPRYTVDIANKDLFETKLNEAYEQGKLREFATEKESNWGGIFLSFLPILLIPVIWIFLMRRMAGGGGAGGGGGQIVCVGSTRAKLCAEKRSAR